MTLRNAYLEAKRRVALTFIKSLKPQYVSLRAALLHTLKFHDPETFIISEHSQLQNYSTVVLTFMKVFSVSSKPQYGHLRALLHLIKLPFYSVTKYVENCE